MGNNCGAHTFPHRTKNPSAKIEHEATTVKLVKIKFSIAINVEFQPKAIALIVNGFSKDVLNKLPMEFAVEAQKLLEISLEGSVG
jgi:Fe-S cluster assembly protein SufB